MPSLPVAFEHPHPRGERGSDAESDEVGQRVVLDAEFAGRVGQTGDFPVQAVHEGAEQDSEGTSFDIALHREEHGKKARKQAGSGKKVREDIHSPPNGFFFLHNKVPVGILRADSRPRRRGARPEIFWPGCFLLPRPHHRWQRQHYSQEEDRGQPESRNGSCRSVRRGRGCRPLPRGRRSAGR